MSGTTYPDVPNAPGVPPVQRDPSASGDDKSVVMTADGADLDGYQQIPQWGIFDQSGDPVLIGDSVFTVDFRKEFRISDYPIEDGGFGSYNKVELPFDAKVRYSIGGTIEDRSAFLADVANLISSLDLYTVVMPEFSYPSADIVHYDFRRTFRDGAALLLVEVWVEEVRVTGTSQSTKSAMPSGADPTNGGTVTPQTATPTQAKAATPTPSADSPHDTPSNAQPAQVIST